MYWVLDTCIGVGMGKFCADVNGEEIMERGVMGRIHRKGMGKGKSATSQRDTGVDAHLPVLGHWVLSGYTTVCDAGSVRCQIMVTFPAYAGTNLYYLIIMAHLRE